MNNEPIRGDKVIIKDCGSMPQIVGKVGTVVALRFVYAKNKYPIEVELDEPVMLTQDGPFPGMKISMPFIGPHLCRPDELELVGETKPTVVPDASKLDSLKKMYQNDKANQDTTGGEAKP